MLLCCKGRILTSSEAMAHDPRTDLNGLHLTKLTKALFSRNCVKVCDLI